MRTRRECELFRGFKIGQTSSRHLPDDRPFSLMGTEVGVVYIHLVQRVIASSDICFLRA